MNLFVSIRRLRGALICLLALVVTLTSPTESTAESAAGFYQGETIKLVVGYAPGGGFDTLARLLAPQFEKKTGATVVVENRPGGGGMIALNQVVGATPDGLTLMLVNGQAAALAQLLDLEGTRFDLMVIPWLGRVSADPSVVLIGKKSPYKNIQDMQQTDRPVKWAGGGKADIMADTAACFSEALQLKSRTIIGYKGSKEATLAVMRGETDAVITSGASARKYAKGGELIPLVVLSRQRTNLLPDVPTIFEVVDLDDQHAWWIDFRMRINQVGRVLMTTPETPKERIDYLSSITAQILTDTDFIDAVQAKGRLIDFAEPDQVRSLLDTTLGALEDNQLEKVRAVILEKYYH